MKIVIATDSFKETLTSAQAGRAIRDGARRVWPTADVTVIPIADGGEGTVDALLDARGGQRRQLTTRGPLGDPVTAEFALVDGGRTAVIEAAASSGLGLVRVEDRNPTRTSTFGTGQEMAAALDAGVQRVFLGIGGSATIDGGCGCGQALGIRFFDAAGHQFPDGMAGGDLDRVAAIDATGRHGRLDAAQVVILCDVDNPLCGPHGAAATYGPQKGATPQQVAQLDRGLHHLATVIARDLGVRVAHLPGAGAAGGLGAGLVAFTGAQLQRGIECVMDLVGLADRIRDADLVITGEGRIDAQSSHGKVISGIAQRARRLGVRVIAIGGCLGPGAESCEGLFDAVFGAGGPGGALPASLDEARRILTDATARHLAAWKP